MMISTCIEAVMEGNCAHHYSTIALLSVIQRHRSATKSSSLHITADVQ